MFQKILNRLDKIEGRFNKMDSRFDILDEVETVIEVLEMNDLLPQQGEHGITLFNGISQIKVGSLLRHSSAQRITGFSRC